MVVDELEPELDLVGAILQAITAKLETVWTVLPARVTSVQGDVVTAEPTVRNPSGTPIPAAVGVRVVQPLAGSVGVGVPVSVGTEGLLVACTLDPSGWLLRGAVVTPDPIRHNLGFSVFLPGVGPSAPARPTKPTIGDLSHTAYPIARGDVVDALFTALHPIMTGSSATVEPVVAALQAAWVSAFPSPTPPISSSTDAEVTSE